MKFQTSSLITTIAFGLSLSVVHAQTAVESFDYQAGVTLAGQGSAADTGFDGPWTNINGTPFSVSPGSLNAAGFPAFAPAGNHVFFNTSRVIRNLDRVYSGETDETLYISFLRQESMSADDADMVYSALELFNGGTSDKVNRVFALGAMQNDSANPLGEVFYKQISARMNNVQDTVEQLGARSTDIEFYVLKIELKANDSDSVYIYRNPTGSALGEPTAVVSDLAEYPFSFDRLAISTWDHPDGKGFKAAYDEVRMGPTLADVMDIGGSVSDWYGYTPDSDGWVETAQWLGRVNVTLDPWIWSVDLGKYLYVTDDSGWVWAHK